MRVYISAYTCTYICTHTDAQRTRKHIQTRMLRRCSAVRARHRKNLLDPEWGCEVLEGFGASALGPALPPHQAAARTEREREKTNLGVPIFFNSPPAESFGVSAQIGSGVVRGGPEVRFHEGSTRVPQRFYEVLQGVGRGGLR